jgi:hypothetical protein
MTPQEQKLIQGVADRLRNANLTEKDSQAESFIQKEIGGQPDSTYVLTQAVILQEHALKQAQSQIENLKKRAEQARDQTEQAQQPPGANFLGGLFGGSGRQQPAAPPSRPVGRTGQRDPWGGTATAPQAAPGAAGGGFGSFMRGAASVAVGVAGGYLLANALQGMLSGEEEGAEELAEQDAAETGDVVDEPLAEAEDTGGEYGEYDDHADVADDYDPDAGLDLGDDDFGGDDWG